MLERTARKFQLINPSMLDEGTKQFGLLFVRLYRLIGMSIFLKYLLGNQQLTQGDERGENSEQCKAKQVAQESRQEKSAQGIFRASQKVKSITQFILCC